MSNRTQYAGSSLTAIAVALTLCDALAAQTSDAAAVQASLTVEAASITVTAVQDLLFGTHFTSAGTVSNEQPGEWLILVNSVVGTAVDYTMTVLPTSLSDGNGNSVPLRYGNASLVADCRGLIVIVGDPATGITNCEPDSSGRVRLGPGPGASSSVTVDLTNAIPGTYTATIELTATIR